MSNPNFSPEYSTNSVWVNENQEMCLTDYLDDMEADIDSLQTGKANTNHTHAEYAPLEHEHVQYALTTHTHEGYAAATHSHPEYALSSEVDTIQSQIGDTSVSAQISAAVSSKADVNHTHSYNDLTDKPTTPVSSLVDNVSEEGTYGNFTYRKWENGTSEAWYYENFGEVELKSLSAFGVWSNDAYNARSVNFPSGLFNSIPMAVCNVYSSGYTFSQVASATKDSMVYRIWAPSSATINNVSIVIYVVGKWK